YGAQGGAGAAQGGGGGAAGRGGRGTATNAVTPGAGYQITVAGRGGDASGVPGNGRGGGGASGLRCGAGAGAPSGDRQARSSWRAGVVVAALAELAELPAAATAQSNAPAPTAREPCWSDRRREVLLTISDLRGPTAISPRRPASCRRLRAGG